MNALLVIAIVYPLFAHGAEMKTLDQIRIRDPFVLPVKESGTYYLYGTCRPKGEFGFYAYKSKDLRNWEGPIPVFRPEKGYWGQRDFWAPEVYAFKGKYYMFCTFSPENKGPRGTAILVAASPEGPFAPHSDGAVTPKDWYALDGTLFIDKDEKPWMVFCHEWIQIGDGAICAVRLSGDLSRAEGEPKVLFHASQAPWGAESSYEGKPGRVTDGPFLFHTADGGLSMLWSTPCKGKGYAVGLARSASGSIDGPWTVSNEPLFSDDGGHAMLFSTFEGEQLMSLHQPNKKPNERARFLNVQMLRDGLQLKQPEGR